MQLFDDEVSGDVRDPYTEPAERRREGAVQSLDSSGMPVADALIDRFADRGRAELTREFTFPFPTQMFRSPTSLPVLFGT